MPAKGSSILGSLTCCFLELTAALLQHEPFTTILIITDNYRQAPSPSLTPLGSSHNPANQQCWANSSNTTLRGRLIFSLLLTTCNASWVLRSNHSPVHGNSAVQTGRSEQKLQEALVWSTKCPQETWPNCCNRVKS